jgi:hypothetical protein
MSDRFTLHGTYRTSRFCLGAKVKCQVRGELTIIGVTDALIPWPLGKNGRGAHSLVVYGDLARAVRRESVSAICHWFGVHDVTVWEWRKAFGVLPSSRVRDDCFEAPIDSSGEIIVQGSEYDSTQPRLQTALHGRPHFVP